MAIFQVNLLLHYLFLVYAPLWTGLKIIKNNINGGASSSRTSSSYLFVRDYHFGNVTSRHSLPDMLLDNWQ